MLRRTSRAAIKAVRATQSQARTQRRVMASSVDYDRFLTPLSKRRQPSAIRSLQPLVKLPGMISLGGGMPAPQLFPFKALSFRIDSGQEIALTPEQLAEALQYSPTPGLPAFVAQLSALQKREHSPPYKDWQLTVTSGSQDALWKAFEMLMAEGDNVLVDEPTYSGALSFIKPLNVNLIGIGSDADGLIPEKLDAALKKLQKKGKAKPKVLYTIPTGQNPAGSTCSQPRKKQIYQLACEHDFIVLEDDPYWFLYYGDAAAPAEGQEHLFKRPHNPSMWSMDTQGRVMRFDSFSKVLSSGIRLGFASGPSPLIERMNLNTQATALHSSGVGQMMASRLMATWGDAGWDAHTRRVAIYYARRRDRFMHYARKHLTGLADFHAPTAGMFCWMKLRGIDDSKALIEKKAVEAKVILVPGQAFSPNDAPSPYVRASFSVASDNEMDTALERLATLIKNHRKS